MKKITLFASNDTMGDTTRISCDNFRKYCKEILESEYPEFEIEVTGRQSLNQCHIEGVEDYNEEVNIKIFCSGLWDSWL